MAARPEGSANPGKADAPRAIDAVLLVEDNMLIALDTEDALLEAGVGTVLIAADVDGALAQLARGEPDFALLDYNLGEETSERVAEALAAAGVPFCYATGYGDAVAELAAQPFCGVLRKPYSQTDIVEMLVRAIAAKAGGE